MHDPITLTPSKERKGIIFPQRNYVLDLQTDTWKLGAKSCNAVMLPTSQLTKDTDIFDDPKKCVENWLEN